MSSEPAPATPPAGGNFVTRFFQSHPKGFWFFFWGEFAERCSYYGMRAILAKYMTDKLGFGQDDAATAMSVFIGACYFLPLVGGWIADNYIGKYWTIVGFSIPYILGHFILGFENEVCLVVALALLAMGSGVIKPNISTLMGLTYDQQKPGQTKLRSDAFAIFYFAINIGAAVSQFLMPPIRTSYGYAIAFLFPAALMVIAFIIFAAGKKYYAVETIVTKSSLTPEDRVLRWRVLGRIFGLFFLVMFFWGIFDQAASTWIFFTEACMDRHVFGWEMDADQMQAFNPVLILILLPPITIYITYLNGKGWKIRPTDKMIVGFILTAACMGVMATAAGMAGEAELRPGIAEGKENKPLAIRVEGAESFNFATEYNREKVSIDATGQKAVVVSWAEFADGKETGAKLSLSFTGPEVLKLAADKDDDPKAIRVEGPISKVTRTWKKGEEKKEEVKEGTFKASFEGAEGLKFKTRWFVAPEKQVTVWWLVLGYLVITIAEVLISVTGLELAYTAAPKSMTSFVTACWLLTVAFANWFVNIPVTRLYPKMQPMHYFGMLTALMILVTVAFVWVAQRFNQPQTASASEPPA